MSNGHTQVVPVVTIAPQTIDLDVVIPKDLLNTLESLNTLIDLLADCFGKISLEMREEIIGASVELKALRDFGQNTINMF